MSSCQNISFKRPVLFIPDKMTQFHGIQRTVLNTVLSYVWFSWRMSGSGEPFFTMSGFLSLRLKWIDSNDDDHWRQNDTATGPIHVIKLHVNIWMQLANFQSIRHLDNRSITNGSIHRVYLFPVWNRIHSIDPIGIIYMIKNLLDCWHVNDLVQAKVVVKLVYLSL
jgi:hypothetical protein